MDQGWAEDIRRILLTYAVPFAGKILGAIVLWIVGRALISAIQRLVERGMERRNLDVTLARYARGAISVTLTILLILTILSIFGVETTSFAGLITAAGVAIGMAWSGLLSNVAAGVFLVVLRPFKVGDEVTAAGVTGVVKEIGLFGTVIHTGDNISSFCGNAKIFDNTIQNYTSNAYRRVDLKAQLAHGVNAEDAIKRLKERIAKIPNVRKDPALSVGILEFNAYGPVLAVRSFCQSDACDDVTFAINEAIRTEFIDAGYPASEQHHVLRRAT
jgi:small conductance mechanosensitive channel